MLASLVSPKERKAMLLEKEEPPYKQWQAKSQAALFLLSKENRKKTKLSKYIKNFENSCAPSSSAEKSRAVGTARTAETAEEDSSAALIKKADSLIREAHKNNSHSSIKAFFWPRTAHGKQLSEIQRQRGKLHAVMEARHSLLSRSGAT